MLKEDQNRFPQIDRNGPRLRILSNLIAIRRNIHSIGSPSRRVFTRTRPKADIEGTEIPQCSGLLAVPRCAILSVGSTGGAGGILVDSEIAQAGWVLVSLTPMGQERLQAKRRLQSHTIGRKSC